MRKPTAMGRMPWATYLWPGLPELWKRGAWSALALAVGFAALVNLTVVASLVWTEVFPDALRHGAWAAIAAAWIGWAIVARWRDGVGAEPPQGDVSYRRATEQYLQGRWFEAECLLIELVRRDPRDVDAGLMLASLYRHTGRFDEARRQLDRLERFDEAAKWAMEIDRERRWLAELQEKPSADPARMNNGD